MRLIALLLLLPSIMHARDLGVSGQTYPVAEGNLIEVIQAKLQQFNDSGKLKELENKWVVEVAKKSLRPTPANLPRADKTRIHYYTPVASVNENILNAKGEVVVASGVSINTLAKIPYYQPLWVFIDADDIVLLNFAKNIRNQNIKAKVILSKGNIKEAQDYLDAPVFFDQHAKLIQKLKIKSLPAVVTRDKDELKVTEVFVAGEGA